MQDKKKKPLKFFTLKVVIISCVFVVCIMLFAIIADEVLLENQKVIDDSIFAFFDSVTTPLLIQAMKVFTFFGSAVFLLPAYIVLIVWFFLKKKPGYGIQIMITGAATQVLLYTLKHIFHRQRPPSSLIKNLTSYSFPSGHSFSSFIFCSILIYIIQQTKWKSIYKWTISILLLLFSLLIGISRIVLKVHYPTDVFASLLLGIAWAICILWLVKRINRKYKMNETHRLFSQDDAEGNSR